MQLQVKPNSTNDYPIEGFLIKGSKLENWLMQLQSLNIDLKHTPIYAIPSNTANSIWGCFVQYTFEKPSHTLTQELACQCIGNRLFIPEYSIIYPLLNEAEIDKLFSKCPHILHPEFGLFELETPINWGSLLSFPKLDELNISKPFDGPFIPKNIRKVEVKALPPEEMLQAMEEKIFPKKQDFKDEPLNWKEKIKLTVLRTILTGKATKSGGGKVENSKLTEMLIKLFSKQKWVDNLENDLESLEKRNSSELEKLMELFKKDPLEALKYAIPLDNESINRGGNKGGFSMSKRWSSFNLFGSTPSSSDGGNALLAEDSFLKLQRQYTQTAEKLVKEKDFEKAAFVYMKLLKNNHKGAQTLESGKLYPEAASVYLKYVQNKAKAAECYEKGSMTTDAIQIYKEIKEFEKVGDLYLTQNKKADAYEHYNLVIDEYKSSRKLVKASLLYRNKMNDTNSGQEMLLEGWRSSSDSFNCLNNYFQNIEDNKELSQEIDNIFINETSASNKAVFLDVLKYEYRKDKSLETRTQEIAYEIVSELAQSNPSIVTKLENFNKDKSLVKDVVRYKSK